MHKGYNNHNTVHNYLDYPDKYPSLVSTRSFRLGNK